MSSIAVDDDVTVGKFYATFLIQDYFRSNFVLHLFRSARTSWNTFVRPSVRSPARKKNLNHL